MLEINDKQLIHKGGNFTNNSQHGTGWVLIEGSVHDTGVSAFILIGHVFDGQTVCIHLEPESITEKLNGA